MGEVTVRFNYPAIKAVQEKHSNRLAWNAAQQLKAELRRTAPRDSGDLADSFEFERTKKGEITTWKVFTRVKYARYQEYGTGPIEAKPGGVLRFSPKGMSGFIFRPRTRGVPETRFMRRAAAAIRKRDFLKSTRPAPP
jgi:hypothetical protein